MNGKFLYRPFFYLGLSLLIVGCAGFHPYNGKNDELAKSAVADVSLAVEEIQIEFDKEKNNQKALLTAELDAVAKFTQNELDVGLAIVVISDDKLSAVWKKRMFEKRLIEIGLTDDYVEILKEIANVLTAKDFNDVGFNAHKDAVRNDFMYSGNLTCNSLGEVAEIDNDLVKIALVDIFKGTTPSIDELAESEILLRNRYKILQQRCIELRGPTNNLLAQFEAIKQFKNVFSKLEKAQHTRDEALKAQIKIEAAFKDAKNKLEQAMPKQPEKKPSEIISDEIKLLKELIDVGNGFAGLSAEKKLVEQKINEVECILSSVAKENEQQEEAATTECNLDKTQQRVALALSALPRLADSFSDLEQMLDAPPLTSLIMISSELQARLQAINALLVREETRIQLIEEEYNALVDELINYNKVNNLINIAKASWKAAGKLGTPLSLTYSDLKALQPTNKVLAKSKGAEKLTQSIRAINAAIALQLQTETWSLRRRYQAEYRAIALDYQASKELSEARVAQWNAMLNPLIKQQSDYHSGGFTTEQVANIVVELLKAGALFTIAGGI